LCVKGDEDNNKGDCPNKSRVNAKPWGTSSEFSGIRDRAGNGILNEKPVRAHALYKYVNKVMKF